MREKIGIYVHIPFCIRKCAYCDFLSASADKESIASYVKALESEIESVGPELSNRTFSSIYFGGGTPSVLESEQLTEILYQIIGLFPEGEKEAAHAEITVECNPGTLDSKKLFTYKQAGVNRLSIGLQSADNKELALLSRIHTWEQFYENYMLAREIGFSNISVDLMSALPGQTLDTYRSSLEKVVSLQPEHISSYSLILEEGTPFYQTYSSGEGLVGEEADREFYHDTKEYLKKAGYNRYEISNYAKPGYESRHNSSYWKREEYAGFGLGASSYFHGMRYHNEENLSSYLLQAADHRTLMRECEVVSKQAAMEEFMYLGLRFTDGISIDAFEAEFGLTVFHVYGPVIEKMKRLGCMEEENGRLWLTEYGLDVSNQVFCEFLL